MTASRGSVRTSASSGFIASIRTMSARQPGAKPMSSGMGRPRAGRRFGRVRVRSGARGPASRG